MQVLADDTHTHPALLHAAHGRQDMGISNKGLKDNSGAIMRGAGKECGTFTTPRATLLGGGATCAGALIPWVDLNRTRPGKIL